MTFGGADTIFRSDYHRMLKRLEKINGEIDSNTVGVERKRELVPVRDELIKEMLRVKTKFCKGV